MVMVGVIIEALTGLSAASIERKRTQPAVAREPFILFTRFGIGAASTNLAGIGCVRLIGRFLRYARIRHWRSCHPRAGLPIWTLGTLSQPGTARSYSSGGQDDTDF